MLQMASFTEKNFKEITSNQLFIGKGSFGEVYGPCIWKDKTLAIKKRMFGTDATKIIIDKQLTACGIWMSMRHKNLIAIYEVSFDSPVLYVLMEFAAGGSLQAVLEACASDLPLEIMRDWGTQIAEGISYLHQQMIVHRDLKSPNIVIMEPDAAVNPYGKTLKITDFDQIREHDRTVVMSEVGTYAWMAPEFIDNGSFSKASDIWSYGVVLWEILTRKLPHRNIMESVLIDRVLCQQLTLEIQDSCPEVIKQILIRCLRYDKRGRPPSDEIQRALQNPAEDNQQLKQWTEDDRTISSKLSAIKVNDNMPTTEETIEQHRDFLEERMDPDSGLLDALLANGTLSRNEIAEIKDKSPFHKRNAQLLNYILTKRRGDRLIATLRETEQLHIANYLSANGEYDPKYGAVWPLTAEQTSKLDANQSRLIDKLEVSELLYLLYSTRVINSRQMSFVAAKPDSKTGTEALLDILRRRSSHDYQQTIECLHRSKQSHIATMLLC